MTDWVSGTEKRNYGIRKKNAINARELFWVLFLLVPVTGSLIFHLWVRTEITDIGYKIQELSMIEESLVRERAKLLVKEENLQNPERIDHVARARLGMEPLRPDQVLSPGTPFVRGDRSVMAMVSR